MENNLWDWWWNDEDLVNIGQIPPGIAILGYLPTKRFQLSNYIVLTKLHSPVPFYKEQNIAEIDIPGRNTPVLQAMGGRGLKYIPIEFTLYGETAHQDLMTLCGWVDAGDPMYFGFDVWVRKILMKNLYFTEEKHHTWYTCSSELWKYEPLKTLKYPKDVSGLRPIPEIPPTQPQPPGGGGGEEEEKPEDEWCILPNYITPSHKTIKLKKKEKGGNCPEAVDCVPYTIKPGDNLKEIIALRYNLSYTDPIISSLFAAITYFNVAVGNLPPGARDPSNWWIEGFAGRTICLPRTISIEGYGEVNIK